MASKFDVLNVIAGAYKLDVVRPSDNYNGITVAFTDSGLHRVDSRNDNGDDVDAVGTRVSVDLLAPGSDGMDVATKGGVTKNTLFGTSLAAPHVTGAVALLNEYSDYETYIANEPRWDVDNPRRHEVLKAVLLNSADKNVLNEDAFDWDDSTAFTDDTVSLDQQMGAGLLDAGRALRQFKSGEYNVFEQAPPIGWDYHETGGAGTVPLSYPLAAPLSGGKVTITLAWDRGVVKSGGPDNTFVDTDMFTGQDVANLDLFLLPQGWSDLNTDSIPMLRSMSEEDNVEHIYADVEPGNYEIVVYQATGDEVDYGLAWWTGDPADFDQDGDVDADDLAEWKMDFGGTSESDADFDTDSDGNDFLAWQRHLGFGVPAVAAEAPVPERGMSVLCCLALPLVTLGRRK